ncbi:uncharacterized protein LOC135171213 [Diachasmimorpha longicaudata]|uniref:uncharacterized protein LOC135171213 n=1 Tax=Diachasmimorpha longicaudata TaxID=58733 RepID=UPI0030B8F6FB
MCILQAQDKLLTQVETGTTLPRNIIKKAVYNFLRECLPSNIQDIINEEHGKSFPRNNCEVQHSDVLGLDDENAEYGVKKKRQSSSRKSQARKQPSAMPCADRNRDRKQILTIQQPEDVNGIDESETNHDWDVLEYLWLAGHGPSCPYL